MLMKLLEVDCNLKTLEDSRGGVFTFIPKNAIVEFNYIITNPGKRRGFHFHPEFDEYVLVISGQGVYIEYVDAVERAERVGSGLSLYPFILMNSGNCIYFPKGCAHTLTAITEVRMVALLTKKWNDCKIASVRVTD